ncbi:MAG: hypothetical protein ACLQPN_06785 [Bryobacteraceae bacterium]
MRCYRNASIAGNILRCKLSSARTSMPSFGTGRESSQEVAAESLRRALATIPTVFGRLAYLASLRDPITGHYSHERLSLFVAAGDLDRTVLQYHNRVFSEWLGCSLADQKNDLSEYLVSSSGPRYASYYRNLAPVAASDVERLLYFTDLETLMDLLRVERDVVFSIATASPLQRPAQ